MASRLLHCSAGSCPLTVSSPVTHPCGQNGYTLPLLRAARVDPALPGGRGMLV